VALVSVDGKISRRRISSLDLSRGWYNMLAELGGRHRGGKGFIHLVEKNRLRMGNPCTATVSFRRRDIFSSSSVENNLSFDAGILVSPDLV
jgi:hypothetical protein